MCVCVRSKSLYSHKIIFLFTNIFYVSGISDILFLYYKKPFVVYFIFYLYIFYIFENYLNSLADPVIE